MSQSKLKALTCGNDDEGSHTACVRPGHHKASWRFAYIEWK